MITSSFSSSKDGRLYNRAVRLFALVAFIIAFVVVTQTSPRDRSLLSCLESFTIILLLLPWLMDLLWDSLFESKRGKAAKVINKECESYWSDNLSRIESIRQAIRVIALERKALNSVEGSKLVVGLDARLKALFDAAKLLGYLSEEASYTEFFSDKFELRPI